MILYMRLQEIVRKSYFLTIQILNSLTEFRSYYVKIFIRMWYFTSWTLIYILGNGPLAQISYKLTPNTVRLSYLFGSGVSLKKRFKIQESMYEKNTNLQLSEQSLFKSVKHLRLGSIRNKWG